jgi:hypothetical protein
MGIIVIVEDERNDHRCRIRRFGLPALRAGRDGIALETPDCVLVTADERYIRAARAKGRIVSLTQWEEQ